MASLANCIKRAGKAISAADADVLKQSRQEYIEAGETAQRATERAIIDMIRTIEAERQDLVEQITAKGGVVGEYAPFVDAVAQPAGKVPDVKSERQDVVPSRQEKDQEPPAPKARPDGYGKGNKVFTADAAEKARELLRKKLNQMRAGFDPEMALAGLTLAGYHIEAGAREFASYVRAMIEDLGDGIRPYLRGYYENVRGTPGFDTKGMSTIAEIDAFEDTEQNANSEGSDAPVSGEGLERDSAAPGDAARNDNGAFFDESGATGQGAGLSGAEAGGQRAQSDSNSGLPRTVPDPDGRGGDPGVPGRDQSSPAAGSGNRGGGNAGGSQRSPAGRAGAGAAKAVAPEARELKQEQRQAEADQIAVKAGDLDNIRATLPVLLPQQQEDVEFAEKRLLVNKGRGVMFTNGTGTGKTFTGLGTIKRYHRMGKRNILIVVPNDKVASDWQKSGTLLGLEIHQLENTKDGGRGVSVTTYANFYQNEALHDTNWDLVVLDESHYLLQKDDFAPTQNLDAMRAIARHPDGLMRRFHAVERDFLSEYEAAKARLKSDRVRAADNDQAIPDAVKSRERVDVLSKQYDQKLRNLQESYKQEWNDHKGADILFLSATPFAYRKSIEYAAGFLFDYGTANENGRSYNRGNAREQFFVANFGYRMKHNKLNDPDKRFIDLDLMERNFSDGLRRAGSVRSRMLEVEFDYDRRFIAVDDLIGHKVDGGRAFIDAKRDEYRKSDPDLADSYWALSQDLEDKFGYLERAFLLESIKAKHSIPYIKKYLAQGKKVVVFHDFNKGGGFHPFRVLAGNPASKAAFDDFKRLRPDLMNLNFDSLLSPRDTLRAAFGDKALFISGLEPKKQKRQSIDKFNSDGGEHNLIIVQADSGREGISLHDTSGKHQRVLLNLGLPNKPIASIQTEGRIYRTFLKSNAIQRYMATGLALENWAIASKLAARSGTAENLAMGSMARGLKESFALALDEAQAWEPGHDGEGTGGKQRDRELVQAPTEFERAKTYYYAQQKISANRDQREGADYFATPEPVGLKMVEWASIQPGDAALEPSAGHGAILRFMPDSATVHFIEQSGSLASKAAIAAPFASFKERNFEDHHIVNKYDAIVMNPPFGAGGGTARDHVAKAITHLKNKGRIVALIPAGPSADKKFEKLLEDSKDIFQVAEIKLPKVTFSNAGTMVGTRILVLQKETNAAEIGDVPESVNIDLSNAENINELFSRIESLAIKGRPAKAEESAMPAQNADALPKTEKPAYSLHKFQHTKTKADVFVAKAEAFLGDAYQSVLAKAKANNGWYNAYGVAPSVKGFAFHSEADRQKFLDAVGGEKDANKEPRAKVSLAPNNPQSLARVKKIVANLQKTLQAVPIEVAESFADLPQAVQDWANERGYADRLQAVYHNGKAYVVADKAGTAREIVKSVLHEVVGHHGIQGVLGERINAVLDQIAASLNGKATLPNGSDIAKAYGLDWNDPAQRREIVEEYLAHLAETGARPGFIRMVAAKIRAMLRKAFPQLKWSDGDILDLLAQSRKYVSRVRSSGAAGTRASVSTLANTIEKDGTQSSSLKQSGISKQDAIDILGGDKEIPSGWYVHGRSRSKKLSDKWVIQMTRDIDVATSYAGENGSVWIIRPKNSAVDFTHENTADMDLFIAELKDRFESGESQAIQEVADSIELATGKSVDFDVFEADVRNNFTPSKIVDTAMAYDSDVYLNLLEHYPGGFPAFIHTPDGAVSLPGMKDEIDAVSLTDLASIESDQPPSQSIRAKAAQYQSDNQSRARLINFSPAYDAVANTTIATPQAWQPFWKRVWNTIKNDYLPQSMKEFKQGVFDQFHSIEDLEKEVNGALLDGSESAYKAALRTQNLSSVMEAVMQKGVLEYANGGVRLKTGSKGFMDIFKEIHQADLMREWEVWAAAKRASRLITEGKERNFNQAQIDTVLREVDSKPAVKAMFERAQRDWITFNKGMLDFAESAGLIDPMERAVWEKDDYLPFHRINQLEDEPAKGPGRNKGLSGQKAGIRKLKGGVEKISPLESMVLNTTHLVDAAFRNIAMQRVAELAEQTQVMTPLNQVPGLTPAEIEAQLRELGYDPATMTPTQIRAWTHNIQRHAKKGDGVVTVSENGKLKAYKVEDALLMRAITSMGHHGVEGVMRLFRGAKRLLTNAVTADPAFMLRNFLRDSLSTAVTVDAKITPIADAIRKMSGNEDLRWQLQAAGAGGGGFHDTSPEDVRAHLSKLRKGNKVIRSVKDAWDAWQKIGSRFENANRLAVADKILKDGGTLAEAAHEAQDVLNFTRRGDYRVMQILIEMTPFLNARVQGLERLWRGAMENTPQGLKMRQHFWMRGMIITGLTLALLAANWDDDRYWELPEWDRDTYYHFFVGDEHFRLPKPFEVGAIFSTIPERMFEQMRADADAKLLGERMLHMIQDTFALAQVPQLFKPAYEVATNTNGFTGRPVVSYALQFVQPEAQYDPYTSETMRWIADAMPNVAPDWMRSPKKLEHALRGYVGAIGGYAVDMADFLGRNAFDMPDTPALRGRDWPVVKSFYQTGVGPTKHTDQLYQMAEAANELQSAIKKYKEEGRIEKAKDLESDNMAKLLARTAINRAVRQMSELNGQTRKILNANVPADLKRSRVDALQKQKQKLAADVVEKYRASFR